MLAVCNNLLWRTQRVMWDPHSECCPVTYGPPIALTLKDSMAHQNTPTCGLSLWPHKPYTLYTNSSQYSRCSRGVGYQTPLEGLHITYFWDLVLPLNWIFKHRIKCAIKEHCNKGTCEGAGTPQKSRGRKSPQQEGAGTTHSKFCSGFFTLGPE